MEEMVKLIGNLGFPAVVTGYLLVRIEGKLDLLTSSLTELTKAIIANHQPSGVSQQ